MSAPAVVLTAVRAVPVGLLAGVPLNRCDAPIITAVCASLTVRGDVEQTCGGLLAYQDGRWQHVNACLVCAAGGDRCLPHLSCCDPQPESCGHPSCTQPADIDQTCACWHMHCCGCCWELDDELAGRRMWLR